MTRTDSAVKQPAVSNCGVKKSIPIPHFCTASFLWFDHGWPLYLAVTGWINGNVQY